MDDRETVEHVPWAELTGRSSQDRRQMLVIGGAVGAALLVGLLIGRSLLTQVPVAVGVVPTSAVVSTEPSTATTVPPLYSEADLYGSAVPLPEQAAAARAEWFVTDFFTADLDPAGGADIRAALAETVSVPNRAEEAAGSVAYVEWARAMTVERVGTDTYRVDVAFRAVGAPPDRGFLRLPVKAVSVTIAVSANGGTTVLDLPTPIVLPAGPEPVPWPTEEAQAPAEVVAGAIALATAWGSEPRLLASQTVAEGWRLVMTITDDVGNRWPMVVTLDAAGRPVR